MWYLIYDLEICKINASISYDGICVILYNVEGGIINRSIWLTKFYIANLCIKIIYT